ncbi:MAG: glutaminase A [Chromatiales bacterium]|nr:glutaminase A [Chromatiales bacterium]
MMSDLKRWQSTSMAAIAAVLIAAFNMAACTTAVARDTSKVNAAELQRLVDEAHAKYKDLKDGKNADYIPILATIPSELFGVAIALPDGTVFTAGDVDYRFAIESTSKPFTAALVMQQYGGPQAIVDKIGVEPTGLPFNSKLAIEILDARSVNPLVNAGAISSVSMVKASSEDERWQMVLGNLSDFAGESLPLLDEVYQSEYTTAWGNRGIANNLYNYERLYSDAEEALRVYTKQCSVGVTTRDLAIMGATLANGGVNPKTGKRLINEAYVPELLAIMLTAGFYDGSGYWSMTAGLPSKTGVGGGIVSVVPGKMAIAAFSPRLDEFGNSVRAQNAIRHIAGQLGVGIFGPNPD